MRLLVVTQTLDSEDPVLGFFHQWVEALAVRIESIEVVCLKEGRHALPTHVRVHSLGKERSAARRTAYAWRFLKLAWGLRREYDAVFVHMNQEYVLIAGWIWKLMGKRVYLWRNHYAGSWATDIAIAFCENVFCTSKYSYTAKYAKTVLMPVGVDTERFHLDATVARIPHSILFLSRMAPSKRPEMLIEALALLAERGIAYTADIVGSPLPQDEAYYASLTRVVRERGLSGRVTFYPGVSNAETPALYQAHEIFVNCSPSGMLDKTIFEAAASGAIVLAASRDFAALAREEYAFDSAKALAERLAEHLGKPAPAVLGELVKEHGLQVLMDRLAGVLATTPAIAPRVR